ncbi:unnamed protein product [Ilex paraguariensis]|uniref:Reverse transcriptase domain-containing protein n=1 Tax=Ilex paraguariensis TaxID=185542 RepID=A0ABC8TT35_9AQUA
MLIALVVTLYQGSLPVDLSGGVLFSLFGRRLAESWIYILCAFGFQLPEKGPSPNYMSSAWRVRLGVKFFDYALLGDDIVIADPVVAKSYLEVMEECKVTISKEKSLISNVSALEFAKRFMVYKVTLDFSPVSLRVLRTLSSGVSAFLFSELRVNLLCSYRLRGGSYKVYSRQGLPTSKRWKRHYLLMFSPTGILPLPLKFWLAFPDLGVLTAEQYGMVRAFIMERV